MNKLVYLLFFSIIGGNLHAQGTSEPKYLREANIAFESGKYFEAIDKLNTAYDKIGTKGSLKEKGNIRFKLAESYRHISRYEEANENYDVCIELKYFDVNPKDCSSPVMMRNVKVISKKLPAITHIDRTARLQTVKKVENIVLYTLLKKVNEKIGVPILLNTSFNRPGEPIVETPSDALTSFSEGTLDYLFIENILISRN